MSTDYPGNDVFPTDIIIPDDSDDADMVIMGAALEGVIDRTKWLGNQVTRPWLLAVGGVPTAVSAGSFSVDNAMSLRSTTSTPTTVAGAFGLMLNRLAHGKTIASIDVLFIPAGGHAALPATPPNVRLYKFAAAPGGTAALTTLGPNSYGPGTLATYNDGNIKVMTLTLGSEVVDVEGHLYELLITDETGSNALAGATFLAVRVNYA